MGTVLVWRHVAYEDLDGLELGILARGHRIQYWDAMYDGDHPEAEYADFLVVLGAPIGVYETEHFAFINNQIAQIQKRLDSGKPVLGICFGAQLLAAAAGSRVYKGPEFEFGWGPITLTHAGASSPVASFNRHVFHCHGDTFDLPFGAELLASSSRYQNQAFRIGPHLGVQFHAEVTARGLSRWSIGHVARIKSTIGLQEWNKQIAAHASQHEATLDQFIGRWLDENGGLTAQKH